MCSRDTGHTLTLAARLLLSSCCSFSWWEVHLGAKEKRREEGNIRGKSTAQGKSTGAEGIRRQRPKGAAGSRSTLEASSGAS